MQISVGSNKTLQQKFGWCFFRIFFSEFLACSFNLRRLQSHYRSCTTRIEIRITVTRLWETVIRKLLVTFQKNDCDATFCVSSNNLVSQYIESENIWFVNKNFLNFNFLLALLFLVKDNASLRIYPMLSYR